jgi:YidC/Oxa1 family membrane protein insertase
MTDNKNTILAIVLSAVVLIAWQYFYAMPNAEKQKAALQQAELQKQAEKPAGPPTQNAQSGLAPAAPGTAPTVPGRP